MNVAWDVIILGAGASGMMCALTAAQRGRRTLLLDHAAHPGEKIRISGGGRCNFTNRHVTFQNYHSDNPRFCISALQGFGPHDFIALLERHNIAYHEKRLGQLFCDDSATRIVTLLVEGCRRAGAQLQMQTSVRSVVKQEARFIVETSLGVFNSAALVVATGGKSLPKMGATGFGYDLAQRFGLKLIPTCPALTPLLFDDAAWRPLKELAGLSLEATVTIHATRFTDALLFTHRGLSGPAILQASSLWEPGNPLLINLLPNQDLFPLLKEARTSTPKQELATILSRWLPKRLADHFTQGQTGRLADKSDAVLRHLTQSIQEWRVQPTGSEGYRTAEVTRGGVDTRAFSSKTMECRTIPGLYMIGELLDVTGELGGYNLQWAWSSGYAAGCHV